MSPFLATKFFLLHTKKFLLQLIHLLIFDQKLDMNLINTQVSQDWSISKYKVMARNCLHPYNNLKNIEK